MFHPRDLYTARASFPVYKSKVLVGTVFVTYEVRQYKDLRNLTQAVSYQVLCTQRVVIRNATPPAIPPLSIEAGWAQEARLADTSAASDYPAVLRNSIAVSSPTAELMSYAPRTVNSSVNTAHSATKGTGLSATIQHSSGSSLAQSNTFSASANLGFFGADPTGGLSFGADRTTTHERSRSLLTGSDLSQDSQSGLTDSMTTKEWGCTSYVVTGSPGQATNGQQAVDPVLVWLWGQEYPWDVLRFPAQDNVLPSFVQSLLADGTYLLPPSQLSQFGIDFTMRSLWVVDPLDVPTITHTVDYYTASHWLDSGAVNGRINPDVDGTFTFALADPLDVCGLGLDPIRSSRAGHVAIVGFTPNQFLVAPAPAPDSSTATVAFTTIAPNNTVLVKDTTAYPKPPSAVPCAGFSASETALVASFAPGLQALSLSMSFKLTDTTIDYRLYMKHWKSTETDIRLTFVINNDQNNVIEKFVTSQEAEGGEANLLSFSLRDLTYGSVDFHDYLTLGLNTIVITVAAMGPITGDGYHLRAISIERE